MAVFVCSLASRVARRDPVVSSPTVWVALCAVGGSLVSSMAQATPGDAWLSAEPLHHRVQLELMDDMVNDSVDVFHLRANDPRYAGTSTGDYAGGHLQGAWQINSRWSVDGSYWQRRVHFRNDPVRFQSWHAATQYQWRTQSGWWPSSAVRWSQWGSQSAAIQRSTPVSINGTTLESFKVEDPRDTQVQGDAIATWSLSPATTLNVFGGVGHSQVSTGAISATVRNGGCLYDLKVGEGRARGQLSQPCGDLVDASFNVPVSSLGIDPERQSRYKASFAQAGLSLAWQRGDWGLQGGYLVRQFRRDSVDDSLASQQVTPIKSVRVLSSALSYRITPRWTGALRAEVTSSQLMADVPSVYNALTASRLGQRYGLLSVGLVYVFP